MSYLHCFNCFSPILHHNFPLNSNKSAPPSLNDQRLSIKHIWYGYIVFRTVVFLQFDFIETRIVLVQIIVGYVVYICRRCVWADGPNAQARKGRAAASDSFSQTVCTLDAKITFDMGVETEIDFMHPLLYTHTHTRTCTHIHEHIYTLHNYV